MKLLCNSRNIDADKCVIIKIQIQTLNFFVDDRCQRKTCSESSSLLVTLLLFISLLLLCFLTALLWIVHQDDVLMMLLFTALRFCVFSNTINAFFFHHCSCCLVVVDTSSNTFQFMHLSIRRFNDWSIIVHRVHVISLTLIENIFTMKMILCYERQNFSDFVIHFLIQLFSNSATIHLILLQKLIHDLKNSVNTDYK